jgi:two-component system sensor histidine kinase KdpD
VNRWFFNIPPARQYLISIGGVILLVFPLFLLSDVINYRIVGFVLLLEVSLVALFLNIVPVLIAAILSALLWDVLFMPPRFKFSIGQAEDQLLLMTYFAVVMIHSVLTFKIRQMQQEMSKREERARDLKFYNTLLNSLSHELRTPVTTIIGASDSLLNSDKFSVQDQKDLLTEISTASFRLNRLVENLLGMSRLESGVIKLKKDWCDVNELTYGTLKHLDQELNHHQVNVSLPESLPLFKLDYGLMQQVLINLLTNAIMYTPEGTVIAIRADCLDEKLFLTVSDTGPGFPSKELDRVFDKFYRIHGSKSGGSGLGLSIVRGFVEAHGGTIALRNLPLSGAEFTITIPTEITYLNRLKNE